MIIDKCDNLSPCCCPISSRAGPAATSCGCCGRTARRQRQRAGSPGRGELRRRPPGAGGDAGRGPRPVGASRRRARLSGEPRLPAAGLVRRLLREGGGGHAAPRRATARGSGAGWPPPGRRFSSPAPRGTGPAAGGGSRARAGALPPRRDRRPGAAAGPLATPGSAGPRPAGRRRDATGTSARPSASSSSSRAFWAGILDWPPSRSACGTVAAPERGRSSRGRRGAWPWPSRGGGRRPSHAGGAIS